MCKDNSSNCYPDRRRFHINLLMHMNTGKGKSTIHFLKVWDVWKAFSMIRFGFHPFTKKFRQLNMLNSHTLDSTNWFAPGRSNAGYLLRFYFGGDYLEIIIFSWHLWRRRLSITLHNNNALFNIRQMLVSIGKDKIFITLWSLSLETTEQNEKGLLKLTYAFCLFYTLGLTHCANSVNA